MLVERNTLKGRTFSAEGILMGLRYEYDGGGISMFLIDDTQRYTI